jgi:hypothetical protein
MIDIPARRGDYDFTLSLGAKHFHGVVHEKCRE